MVESTFEIPQSFFEAPFEWTHEMQPYGWVHVENCHVKVVDVAQFDFNLQRYNGTRRAIMILGTVKESSYCGALLCGVPVVKATNTRYPVGSKHEFEIRWPSDFTHQRTVDVAM